MNNEMVCCDCPESDHREEEPGERLAQCDGCKAKGRRGYAHRGYTAAQAAAMLAD